ncbi:response regulator [bacterium]|nr:response regulator [bacterium]MCI0611858.1 response regulator [bacterium]
MAGLDLIRTIIVDDEQLARERLRRFLETHTEFEIVRECSNGIDAVQAILELRPHVIFLDVHLPGLSGFEVIEAIPKQLNPLIILVTAEFMPARNISNDQIWSVMLKPFNRQHFDEILQHARLALKSHFLDLKV